MTRFTPRNIPRFTPGVEEAPANFEDSHPVMWHLDDELWHNDTAHDVHFLAPVAHWQVGLVDV